MNFNLAPVSRIISTAVKDETTYASPTAYTNGGSLGTVSLKSGRAVTLFFETPSCPVATNQIDIKLTEVTPLTCLGIRALPNVYLTDADSYLFIRGNSSYANAASAGDGIHVVYSAIVDGVIPGSRSNLPSGAWIQPGDTLTITAPTAHSSNAVTVSSVDAEVITVRQRSSDTYIVDFTVGIDPDVITGSGLTGWAKNELLYYTGTAGSPVGLKGLAKDQLALSIMGSPKGSSNFYWKGTVKSAVNISYPSANKSGIIPSLDSGLFLLAPKAWAASNGIPSNGTASTLTNLNIYCDPDYNSGAMPFKCLSIVDNSSNASSFYNLEISIIPMY